MTAARVSNPAAVDIAPSGSNFFAKQSGSNRLRYATLMGIKKAKSKETREVEAVAAGARVDEVVKVAPPERVKRTEMLTGSADEVAAKIVEKLKFEVKVL